MELKASYLERGDLDGADVNFPHATLCASFSSLLEIKVKSSVRRQTESYQWEM